jgi:hypothetical protein
MMINVLSTLRKGLYGRHAFSLNVEIDFGSSEALVKVPSKWENVLCDVQEHVRFALVNYNAQSECAHKEGIGLGSCA